MQWVCCGKKSENRVKGEKGKKNLAPSPGSLLGSVSLVCLEAEPGPLAMSYEEATGWTTEKIGPNNRHWKWLACEVKKEKKGEIKGHKAAKREGPIPLCELDPNTLEQKRRKARRQTGQTEDGKEQMVGREAVAVGQHRRAS